MSKNESSKKATDNKVEEKGKKVYKNKDGYYVVKGRRIDPATTIIPLIIVLILGILFIAKPDGSTTTVSAIRDFLGDKTGLYYLVIALGIFLASLYIAFTDLGKIRLGKKDEKPKYGFFAWGAMVFCCGLAADILFYSFCEWIYYAEETHVQELGNVKDWASTYPLFHWGPTVWSFYAILAACFGFMIHVRGSKKQMYSEACRPILGKHTDGIPRNSYNLQCCHTSSWTGNYNTFRYPLYKVGNNSNPSYNLWCLYNISYDRYEGCKQSVKDMYVPLWFAAYLCIHCRRTGYLLT